MKMNTLINKVSDIFKDEDRVKIHIYDAQKVIELYAYVFTNIELRKLWRIVQGELIEVGIEANSNVKVCITLLIKEEIK